MKAIIQDRYGTPEDLRFADVALPVRREDEVLVQVKAASVHADVWHVMTGQPYVLRAMGAGVRRPNQPIPGTDMSGVVARVGSQVTRFQPGDEVFGETVRPARQWTNGGAFAEYVSVPEEVLAHKPDNLTFVEAAAVPTAGLIALQGVRQEGDVAPGHHVLINGAAGGVGHLAVQMAKAAGAEVTAVDTGDKLDMLRSIGADHVIDFTVQDFTEVPAMYDVIIDIPGNHSFAEISPILDPHGRYVLIGHDGYGRTRGRWLGSMGTMMTLMASSAFREQVGKPDFTIPADRMEVLTDLLARGEVKPVIDRTYPLSEAPAAMQYLMDGGVRGKVVLTV